MATASGDGKGTRRALLPFVAYALVLALLGLAGGALWMEGTGGSPATSKATPVEPAPAARGLKLPPRPADAEATGPSRQEPAQAPAPVASPPQSQASNDDAATAAAEKSEPRKTKCTADVGPWPTDSTDQAKAIQILLRDLGFYSGTTYGTVGPATRAAIRKFQLAADEAETGEPSEMLFESLKKKCASSTP
jgi:hypothetical protein